MGAVSVKRIICFFINHKFKPVRLYDMWMVPTVGLTAVFEPHVDGQFLGCERCGLVKDLTDRTVGKVG
jgi:hypothetical protein